VPFDDDLWYGVLESSKKFVQGLAESSKEFGFSDEK
jgi:hypothetical protein